LILAAQHQAQADLSWLVLGPNGDKPGIGPAPRGAAADLGSHQQAEAESGCYTRRATLRDRRCIGWKVAPLWPLPRNRHRNSSTSRATTTSEMNRAKCSSENTFLCFIGSKNTQKSYCSSVLLWICTAESVEI